MPVDIIFDIIISHYIVGGWEEVPVDIIFPIYRTLAKKKSMSLAKCSQQELANICKIAIWFIFSRNILF